MLATDMTAEIQDEHYDAVLRLRKDIATAAESLTPREARYLVDLYYQIQRYRLGSKNQVRQMTEEPHVTLSFLVEQMTTLEKQIARALDIWTREPRDSQWARSQVGIGPVIAAGLRAHIDIARAPHVGHVWSFAGLAVNQEWKKGQKRPWNAQLKILCWKVGESFVKTQNSKGSFYGPLYAQRKAWEQERNERGEYADQAARSLERMTSKDTVAKQHYAEGKLPPGHVHARAKRWVVKLFLAHYHHVLHECHYGTAPARPYVIDRLGHADYIPVPGW